MTCKKIVNQMCRTLVNVASTTVPPSTFTKMHEVQNEASLILQIWDWFVATASLRPTRRTSVCARHDDAIQSSCARRSGGAITPRAEWFHIAAAVACIVGGQRWTRGHDQSEPPASAARGNVGKRGPENNHGLIWFCSSDNGGRG